jgi:hypothetical protein
MREHLALGTAVIVEPPTLEIQETIGFGFGTDVIDALVV